jgi:hypothetical protein
LAPPRLRAHGWQVALPQDLSESDHPHDANKIMYYEGYNFTIYTRWSPFLVRSEEIPDSPGIYNLYLGGADDWLSFVPRFDYLLLSGELVHAADLLLRARAARRWPLRRAQHHHQHHIEPVLAPDGVP